MTAFHWFAFAAFLASFGFSVYGIQGMTKYTLQSGLYWQGIKRRKLGKIQEFD